MKDRYKITISRTRVAPNSPFWNYHVHLFDLENQESVHFHCPESVQAIAMAEGMREAIRKGLLSNDRDDIDPEIHLSYEGAKR